MMTMGLKRGLLLLPFVVPFLLGGCVSESRYDYLEGQYKQLQQSMGSQVAENSANTAEIAAIKKKMDTDEQHIRRLQGAIKYTVNSDLLFPSGSWKMSTAGQQIIAKLAPQLAPYQDQKIVVNGYTDNAPIGAALRKQGITSNEMLSQKRAETVMQFLISQGVKPNLVSAKGMGDADPVASNDTAQGRAQNRRVEVSLAEPAP
jgi:chemotaxis protein MotB